MWKKRRVRRALRRFLRKHSLLRVRYRNWYVGVTNDFDRRMQAHTRQRGRTIQVHKAWKLRRAEDAAAVEKNFLDRGMRGAGGGWAADSRWVYVYKVRGWRSR